MMKQALLYLMFLVVCTLFTDPVFAKGNSDDVNDLINSVEQEIVTEQKLAVTGTAPNNADAKYQEYRLAEMFHRRIVGGIVSMVFLVSLYIILSFIAKASNGQNEVRQIASMSSLVLIVYGAVILPLIAFTDAQLTAPMGILGAVAGYVFGKLQRATSNDK